MPGASAVEKSAADEFREREARWARERETGTSSSTEGKAQRAEWMLVPPSAGVLGGMTDPTKRPTSFAKTSREGVSAADQRVWTETPAERTRRLADEAAGVKRPREGDDADERRRRRERDTEVRRNIEAHNVGTERLRTGMGELLTVSTEGVPRRLATCAAPEAQGGCTGGRR
jgi:hypothetical protein